MCKVSKSPSGCWLWLGSRNGKGYGLFYDERTRKAHRWIYEQSHGSIPAGLTIDHICGVHHCVNPEHMEPVTALENARRGRLAAA